jgi:hypothetical protein
MLRDILVAPLLLLVVTPLVSLNYYHDRLVNARRVFFFFKVLISPSAKDTYGQGSLLLLIASQQLDDSWQRLFRDPRRPCVCHPAKYADNHQQSISSMPKYATNTG